MDLGSQAMSQGPRAMEEGAGEPDPSPYQERALAMKTKREELAMLHERHAELTEALARMGKSKRGTRWETDRIRERENIARQIERLEEIPPVPSYSPGDDPLYEG